MTRALTWSAIAYAVLKLGRFVVARSSGYRDAPPALAERLRAGEPALLCIALALTLPLAWFSEWYPRHKFTALFDESARCFGQVVAYRELPFIKSHYGEGRVYDAVQRHRTAALVAARQLGRSGTAAQRALDARALASRRHYERAHQLGSAEMLETRGCLEPPHERPNE